VRTQSLILSVAVHGAALTAALGFGVATGRVRPMPAAIEVQASEARAASVQAVTVELPPVASEAIDDALPAEAGLWPEPVAEPRFDVPPARAAMPQPPSPTATLERVRVTTEVTPAVEPAAAADSAPAPSVDAAPASDNAPPDYPEDARRLGQHGSVLLDVDVAADGQVLAVELAGPSPFPLLNRAALLAVGGWRFTPARRGGLPMPSRTQVTVTFRLR
jgi:periplasmic protein TonB